MMTGTRGRLKSAQNSPCTSCNAAVKKQDEGMQCDRCGEWWHRACTDIPQQFYDHLSSVRGIMWACANCLDNAKTAMKTSIRDKSIETSLESIKTEVINLKAALVSTDTKTIVNGHTATPVTPDDQSKMGIRINGVPELSNQKMHDRMDSDFQAVRKVMEYLGELGNEPITDSFRLGKYRSDATRPRTLLVMFKNPWLVRKLLAKSYILKDYSDSIYLSRELTVDEKKLESRILFERYKLVETGISKNRLRVRDLNLYLDGKEHVF